MRAWLAGTMLIVAGAGGASVRMVDDRGFCATLRGLLAAAAERPAFASLGPEGPARAARGLGFEHCAISARLYGNRLACSRIASPRYPVGPAMAVRLAACLPDALRMSEPPGSRLARFRRGLLALHVEETGYMTHFRLFALPVER